MCKGEVLLPEHILFEGDQQSAHLPAGEADAILSLKQRIEEIVPEILRLADQNAHANMIDLVEEAIIARALQECGYNQVRTARMLGISRNTLRHRILKYHLEPPT
jgi:DNA-binding NtrC family response regulator